MKKSSLDSENFLRERRFLGNLSETSLKYYGYVFNRWEDYVGEEPNSENIKDFVIKVRESGVSVFTANSYIRGMNAYLTWKETGLRIKKLKEPERVLKLFSDTHIKAMLSWQPKTWYEKRLYAMISLALDGGYRIDEMLGLKREDIDMDNLLVTVMGKGSKERIVPMGLEARKVIYRFLNTHKSDWVFPSNSGRLSYRTILQDLQRLCKKLGVTGVRASWHTMRHTFASNYVRSGGNVFYLQKILGHSDLAVTQIYVTPLPADLGMMHKKTSILSRFS